MRAPDGSVGLKESGRDSIFVMRYASYPYRSALLRRILCVISLVRSTVSGPVRCSWARAISAYIKLESPGSRLEASPLDPGHIRGLIVSSSSILRGTQRVRWDFHHTCWYETLFRCLSCCCRPRPDTINRWDLPLHCCAASKGQLYLIHLGHFL